MRCWAAHGPPTPCHTHSRAAVGARPTACTKASAFRDPPIPRSCSVDTAHAAVISSGQGGDQGSEAPAQPAPAVQPLAWQVPHAAAGQLSAAARNGSYQAVGAGRPADIAGLSNGHDGLLLLQQQHVLRPEQHAAAHMQEQHAAAHSSAAQHNPAAAVQQHTAPMQHEASRPWHTLPAYQHWRLLSQSGQDELSVTLLRCDSIQDLLAIADAKGLLDHACSRWHYARFAAMAAVLLQQPAVGIQQQMQGPAAVGSSQPAYPSHNGHSSSSSSSTAFQQAQQAHTQEQHLMLQHASPALQQLQQQQQQQQQQQDTSLYVQLACQVLQAVTSPCVSTGQPALHSVWGVHLSEMLHAVHLVLAHVSSPQEQQQEHLSQQQQQQQQEEHLLQQEEHLLQQQKQQQQHSLQQQQQELALQRQQQVLQQQLANMPGPLLQSAIHGCVSVEQLHSVVSLTAAHLNAAQLKASFVQLVRVLGSSRASSSDCSLVWQQLVDMLPDQLPSLQPHQCASILWSMGHLQPAFSGTTSSSSYNPSSSTASSSSSSHTPTSSTPSSSSSSDSRPDLTDIHAQLLQGTLSGLEQLNVRVCAQLMHGAAKLRLEVPPAALQALQQHTQMQLQLCDPQALACMLWSLGILQNTGSCGATAEWLQAFYSSSWRVLQTGSHCSSSSSGNTMSGASSSGGVSAVSSSQQQQQQEQQQQEPWWLKGKSPSSFQPVELASLLTSASRLQLQPSSEWLAAIAESSCRQMGSFQQQELGLLLWGFAQLQYVPSRGLLTAAAARAVELGPLSFTPQTLSLLLYGACRLLRWQLPQQQQQHMLEQQQQQQQPWLGHLQGVLLAPEAMQLERWNATDLSLVAWCLGTQQFAWQKYSSSSSSSSNSSSSSSSYQPGQARQFQQRLVSGPVLQGLLQAVTAKLLQQDYNRQQLCMQVWGLGTLLQASPSRNSQQKQQQVGLDQATLAGFLEAAAAAIQPYVGVLSGHESASLVWGLGGVLLSLRRSTGTAAACASSTNISSSTSRSNSCAWRSAVSAATECLDVLFCHLLDGSHQLDNFQLAAAVQGLCWAQHPRGLDLLHLAVQPPGQYPCRLQTAQPQELLLLLRACIAYKYVPEGAAWGGVVGALERTRSQLQASEVAQLLYLLGKLQLQSNRRQQQRAEAAAAAGTWQTRQEQQRRASFRQGLPHVALKPLVPAALMQQLLVQAADCVQLCSTKDVSLMLWGVSHLHRHTPQQQQHSHSSASSSGDVSSSGKGASSSALATQALFSSVYSYTVQQLQSFAPGNLATLLYALQRLHARPDAAWLHAAAMQFTEAQLGRMDGQSLAVLALALAGLNWVSPQSWLGAYMRAVAAADRRGVLVTKWQRQCISNSLAALNPLVGHSWVPLD